MMDAARQARGTVDEFIKAIKSPQPGMRGFVVKMRFVDGGRSEFMWINHVRYSGDQFDGTVASKPVIVKNVAYGDPVSVAKEDIVDWAFYQNDTLVGGYTEKVLKQIRSVQERKHSKLKAP